MHLRYVKSTRKGKTYKYAQLVESYRRHDGKPAVRVVKHLGKMPQAVFDAFRIALQAERKGCGVVLKSDLAEMASERTIANLRYLDLAVLRHIWDDWNLSEIIDSLHGESDAKLTLSSVILSLVLQRCTEPRSKFQATVWVPKTALPELLGFQPQSFENTRVHRSLKILHTLTQPLQKRLVEAYQARDGAFSALFMDVTDTWFEGIGSPMAEQTRTKTEMPNKRCLGIVMLVNERGFPMRWTVVGGKTKDWTAMRRLLKKIGDVQWLRETLVVFDRAMGQACNVASLKKSGLHFLTAAHRTSIDSFTEKIPTDKLSTLEIEGTDESYERDIKAAAQAAREAGMHEIHETLFAVDLGVQTPPAPSKYEPRLRWRGQPNKVSEHLRVGETLRAYKRQHPKATQRTIAAEFGISTTRVRQSLTLLKLSPEIQGEIHEMGSHFPVPEKALKPLLQLESDAQHETFSKLMSTYRKSKSAAKQKVADKADARELGKLRMVAYFNPQLFVDARRRGERHCSLLEQRVAEINDELSSAKRSRNRDSTFRKFSKEIERLHYLDTFDIELEEILLQPEKKTPINTFRGRMTRREKAWTRRHKYDGFVLLLGHPDLPHSGPELVQRYRDKDRVEKCFQTIKSVCKLRPLFHYTDPKVQAHVTLCMLALLLQRSLEERLRKAGLPMSAPRCIEVLKESNLNVRTLSDGSSAHDITQPGPERRAILNALGLQTLADDDYLRTHISPRTLRVEEIESPK